MMIVELGKLTETRGCIRGIYELPNMQILVQFINEIEIVKIKIDEKNDPKMTTLSILKSDVSPKQSLHRIFPLPDSRIAFVYSEKMILTDLDMKKIWESSNQLDSVRIANIPKPKKRNKREIRHRKSIKNPLVLIDRLLVLIVKKTKLLVHDLNEKVTKLITLEGMKNKHILRIRKFDSSSRRIIVMLSGGETRIYQIGMHKNIYLNFYCIRNIKHRQFRHGPNDMIFMAALPGRVVGFSKTSIMSWGIDKEVDLSVKHSLPLYGIVGASACGGKMIASTMLDFKHRKYNECIRSLGLIDTETEVTKTNFYVVIDFEKKGSVQAKLIGRVKKVSSSRGYPILFVPMKKERKSKKSERTKKGDINTEEEEEEEDEDQEDDESKKKVRFGLYLSRSFDEKDGGRYDGRGRFNRGYLNPSTYPRWQDPNIEKNFVLSLYDFKTNKVTTKEKKIVVSRVNDSPAMLCTKSGLVIIGNRVFEFI